MNIPREELKRLFKNAYYDGFAAGGNKMSQLNLKGEKVEESHLIESWESSETIGCLKTLTGEGK